MHSSGICARVAPMRVLFLNQYFPPDPAPTGMLLRELADALEETGHVVDFVDAGECYRGEKRSRGRMRREMKALARVLAGGLRCRRPDVIESASSTPCVLVVATALALWRRAGSVHWLMDMYPEIAVALGEIRPGAFSGAIARLMAWCYRRTDRVVALDADMAARLIAYSVDVAVVRPWVFPAVIERIPAALHIAPKPEWTWIYSGNLGRAHDWATLLEVQAILENRGAPCRLLFQGGGPAWLPARARAEELGLKNCAWSGYVEEEQLPRSLLACQLLVVTQLPAAQGLLWPSKLALAVTLPRPLLWIGPTNGAVAGLLRTLPHAGVFSAGQAAQIADWIIALKERPPSIERNATFDAARHRESSLKQLTMLILEAGERRPQQSSKSAAQIT